MTSKSDSPYTADVCNYVINPLQLGGIETYTRSNGPGAGTRVAWVNTGGGLHYKVAIDRGMDIAEAFYNGMSLAWLSLSDLAEPNMAMNRELDWLWTFYAGLLTSCGPSSAGAPCEDQGQQLSLHGRHSNLKATVESVVNPDPLQGCYEMSITGLVRQAKLFEPNIELRRTICSPLGKPVIHIRDTFINRGNTRQEHAWLLHINLGYPLLEPGSRFLFKGKLTARPGDEAYFNKRNYKLVPRPLEEHRGGGEAAAYIDPKPDRNGMVACGVVNEKRNLAVKIEFSKKQFPRFVNWQHFGPGGQFVLGIEPANCGVEGRDVDRQRGWLDFLDPGQKKNYELTLTVLNDPKRISAFQKACS